jgi:hypothetical protein
VVLPVRIRDRVGCDLHPFDLHVRRSFFQAFVVAVRDSQYLGPPPVVSVQ